MDKRKVIVYLSGKYTDSTSVKVEQNVRTARYYSVMIWEHGFTCLSPILNTARYEIDCNCKYKDYITGDLELIKRCDIIFMTPNWIDSNGAKIEREYAIILGKPIVYNMAELEGWYYEQMRKEDSLCK